MIMEKLDAMFFIMEGFNRVTNRVYVYDVDFMKDSIVNITDLENGTFRIRATNYLENRVIEGIISTKEELNMAMKWCKFDTF